ncbi:acetyl/propionyl/methylcrotonyl-CoA carboxylase subunit alpha [Niabella insulamsoli]|uniref:acetyl/propionyl/methylcrotonyl-CoA carboxylase subunit alpha n=1 Tax=Niabella insulamsoli TaxID=3144874 RepID=UPI0031FDAAA2
MINKILIANRGEIALRIQRTAKAMGIQTIAIFNEADQHAAFVKQADEAVLLEGDQLSDTYLNIEKIIAIAKQANADAIHPGYGFLSEQAAFVAACSQANIIFIGPSAAAIAAMGNKIAARATASEAGVPVTPGHTGTSEELMAHQADLTFPVLIKAAAGGGGKGMRIVNQASELKAALEATTREAKNYFGDGTVYIEKYIANPRHIEVQILGDQQGHIIHLFDRECSLQRRHQKIVEEAPSATLTDAVRQKICSAALQLAERISYHSAGTMEFLVDENLDFYFLEMNTRIQVEHPVTELITGVDIVEQQIRIASGEALGLQQKDISINGHAIECRIYAEDPEENFLPAPGIIRFYEEPDLSHNKAVRIDGMELKSGDSVSDEFDPMISKLIFWHADRESARQAMVAALRQYHIKGIQTNVEFLTGLLQEPDFINNQISTKYIDTRLDQILNNIQNRKQSINRLILLAAALTKSLQTEACSDSSIWQQIGFWRHDNALKFEWGDQIFHTHILKNEHRHVSFLFNEKLQEATLGWLHGIDYLLTVNKTSYPVSVFEFSPGRYEIGVEGMLYRIARPDISAVDGVVFEAAQTAIKNPETVTAPMPGKVAKINVKVGDSVKKGDTLLIVEAMKMEHNILCSADALVDRIDVKEGDKVGATTLLIKLKTLSSH